MVAMSNEEIGKRITEARTKAGLSGKELAEKIGVAASTITRYEKGTFAKIKLPVIEAIARELGLNPMWLLGKSEYPDTDDMKRKWAEQDPYYRDPETARMAQELMDNPNGRILFDASRDLSPEDIKIVLNLIQGLKAKRVSDMIIITYQDLPRRVPALVHETMMIATPSSSTGPCRRRTGRQLPGMRSATSRAGTWAAKTGPMSAV